MHIEEKSMNTTVVIGACPVTTDYIVPMNQRENNNDNNKNSSSSAEMLQVKRSVHNVMYIPLLYTRAAVVVVVDAHNEAPGISRYYTHDDIRAHIKGACFAIPASPPTTLGWPDLQWV